MRQKKHLCTKKKPSRYIQWKSRTKLLRYSVEYFWRLKIETLEKVTQEKKFNLMGQQSDIPTTARTPIHIKFSISCQT